MSALKQARIGDYIYRRGSEYSDWKPEQFASTSLAKKSNGLNSRAFLKAAELPPNRNKRTAERRTETVAVAEDRRQTQRRKP